MNKKLVTVIILMILLVLISVAVNAAPSGAAHDADIINRFFADLQLILSGLKGLIEPIVGLGVAVMIAMQARSLSNQKQSKAILHAQNDALGTIKSAVTPPKEE
jgi:hypothetical protein